MVAIAGIRSLVISHPSPLSVSRDPRLLPAPTEAVLILAVVGALGVAVWPRQRWLRWAVAGAMWAAVIWLASRLARLDLSYTYVADYARRGVGPWYRVAGLWGGPGGSLLFFGAGLATVVAAVKPPDEKPRRVLALTLAVIAALVATVASPFRRLAIPAISGAGMQPILEHPAMLYHPPILYAGLVMTAGLWAHATGGSDWSRIRCWTAGTFAVLTLGQALGANWAYVELGWGGYWGWDPVENGVLVGWLALVATLHAGGLAPRWSHLIAASPWVAILFAAYVTRSGLGGSVHAFADDPATAWAVLTVVAFTMAASVVLVRTGAAPGTTGTTAGPRRQLVGALVAALGAAVIIEALGYMIVGPNDPVVTGHFYAVAIAPLAILALVLSGLALVKTWNRRSIVAVAVGGFVGLTLAIAAGTDTPFALGVAVAAGVSFMSLMVALTRSPAGHQRQWGALLAHAGLMVMLIGIAGSTQRSTVTHTSKPGDVFTVRGVEFQHRDIELQTIGEIDRVVAHLDVNGNATDSGPSITLSPSLDAYTQRSSILAEAALDSRPARDIQVVLRGATDDGSATYDISVTPLVQLVWWGAALMTVGGAAAFFRRRVRADTPAG